jgi:hypothetical protein
VWKFHLVSLRCWQARPGEHLYTVAVGNNAGKVFLFQLRAERYTNAAAF